MNLNPNIKYSSEQIQNKARYAGLYMYYATHFGMIGAELRDAVAYDFRKLYGKKNKDESNN